MALATRCPACGSVFRVVADQLKLRGGLVRCGQCSTVFDAIGALTYLDETQLRQAQTSTPAAPPLGDTPESEREREPAPAAAPEAAPAQAAVLDPDGLPERAAEAFRELAAALAATPALPAPVRKEAAADDAAPRPAAPEAQPESQSEVEPEPQPEPADAPALAATPPTEPAEAPAPPPSAQAATQDAVPATLAEPEFLRRASEQARVVRHRKLWAVASLLAALVLGAQLLFALRSEVLMRWPQAQPIYVQVCERLGCTVEWPAVSDQIAVLASDLQRLPGTPAYELNVTLRNRAPYPQTLPALEVTLTDARGQVVSRRVVPAAEYRLEGQPDHLAPGEDLAARLVFEAVGAAPAGFLVYPFHP